MYNMIRNMMSAVIACAMLLGSVPLQAQRDERSAYNELLSRLHHNAYGRNVGIFCLDRHYSESMAKKVDELVRKFSTSTLPNPQETEAFDALGKLPNSLRKYVVVDGDGFRTLSRDFRVLVPQDFNPKNGKGILYIQQFHILDADGRPNAVSKMIQESFSFDVVSGKIKPGAVPPSGKEVSVLRGVGRNLEGDMVLVSFDDELFARLRSSSVRQSLGFRDMNMPVLDKFQGKIFRGFKSSNPAFVLSYTADNFLEFPKGIEIGLGKGDNMLFDLETALEGKVVVPVRTYYKENLKSIKKLLAAVERKMQNLKGSKALYVSFLELMKKDPKFALNTIERLNAKQAATKQAAAKKAATKKAGKQVGKTALRSVGGAFFGIGVYAVLTATTASSVQAAEVKTPTPRHKIIEKSIADIKDAQIKGGVEKLAMFADPNKMLMIIEDAQLLQEMGQYKTMLEENGLTEEEAAEIIVDEMFAPIATQEEAKQTIIKKVKHI